MNMSEEHKKLIELYENFLLDDEPGIFQTEIKPNKDILWERKKSELIKRTNKK